MDLDVVIKKLERIRYAANALHVKGADNARCVLLIDQTCEELLRALRSAVAQAAAEEKTEENHD